MTGNSAGTSAFNRRFLVKWFLIIFAIKAVMFVYFSAQFRDYLSEQSMFSGWIVKAGDTFTYMNPADDMIKGKGYTSLCRMPGIVPVYAPVSWLFGKNAAFAFFIAAQFFCSVLSVLLIAVMSARLIRAPWAFAAVALSYSFSSFVSIWDHYLISDSFSTSFLIFSVYIILKYVDKKKWKYIVWSAFFLTWSVFLRQIILVTIPVFMLLLFVQNTRSVRHRVMSVFLFLAPLIIAIALWTTYNFLRTQRFVPLVSSYGECYATYTPQFVAANKLLIAWGEDYQLWVKGSAAEWFFYKEEHPEKYHFRESVMTSRYNLDSLISLRSEYADFNAMEQGVQKDSIGAVLLEKINSFGESYKNERAFDFYVTNRLRLLMKFLIPSRLDNLPGPAFADMNNVQKLVKVGYFALLLLVSILGVLGSVLAIFKWKKELTVIALLPWALIGALAILLGYIEQRYFVPVYSFFIVFSIYFLAEALNTMKRYKEKKTHTAG